MAYKQKSADFPNRVVKEALERFKSSEELDLAGLRNIWESIASEQWTGSPTIYKLLGERARAQGAPLLAYDILSTGMKHRSKNVRMRQLLGLVLADLGATERANEILLELYNERKKDGETLGILARTYKDLWERESNPIKKKKYLKDSYSYYLEGFQEAIATKKRDWIDDAIYTGINAATTALLRGQKIKAKKLALEVQEVCLKKLKKEREYWAISSLGEAAIILGEWVEAEELYCQAGEVGHGNYRELSSTRRQARILLKHFNKKEHSFDHCFEIPKVVVFAGHMIDQPGRPQSRFPQAMEKKVGKEIAAILDRLNGGIGYSSAACGSDILFLEAMLRRKAKNNIEINIVLPFPQDQFQKTSVDIIPDSDWGNRFKRVLKRATRVIIASERRNTGNLVAYEYSNLLQDGLAILRAKMLDTEVIPLVVWNGRRGDGAGGTSSLVKHWRSHGLEPEVIDIANLLTQTAVIQPITTPDKHGATTNGYMVKDPIGLSQKIRAMLFADVVGYSKLMEEQISSFVEHFMGAIGDLLTKSPNQPLMKNTWGDAVYFVFSTVKDAGNFAIQLRDRICNIDWKEKGLPEDLNLRISVHAGPVYYCNDPVLKKRNYTGSHVNRAARIESITPPGEVYASQEFVALAAAQRVSDFTCDYVGRTPLPKKSGIVPLYLVRPSNP